MSSLVQQLLRAFLRFHEGKLASPDRTYCPRDSNELRRRSKQRFPTGSSQTVMEKTQLSVGCENFGGDVQRFKKESHSKAVTLGDDSS